MALYRLLSDHTTPIMYDRNHRSQVGFEPTSGAYEMTHTSGSDPGVAKLLSLYNVQSTESMTEFDVRSSV